MDSYALCSKCKDVVHVRELSTSKVMVFGKPMNRFLCTPCLAEVARAEAPAKRAQAFKDRVKTMRAKKKGRAA